MSNQYNVSEDILNEYIGFIYVTVNKENGKSYIGLKHFNKTGVKWDEYLGSGKILKQAIEKYGEDSFYKIIVCFAKTEEELANLEKLIIKVNDAVNNKEFYNISEGGHGGDTFAGYTEEEFKKYCDNLKGENNPFYGKKHSKESVEKMLKKRTGEKHWLYGKHMPEGTKKKLSDIKKKYYKTHVHQSAKKIRIVFNDKEKEYDSIKDAYNDLSLDYHYHAKFKRYEIPKFRGNNKKTFDSILEIYENGTLVFSKDNIKHNTSVKGVETVVKDK